MGLVTAPDGNGLLEIQEIRESAEALIRIILKFTPACADRSAAIRRVHEAIMTASAAIRGECSTMNQEVIKKNIVYRVKSRLLRLREAAQYLRISDSTLREMLDRGEISGVMISRRLFFERDALDQYIASRRTVA